MPNMIKNFISIVSNPGNFMPTVYLELEQIKYGKYTVIYDRVDDADAKVTATSQIAAMYIRKQNIFTEKRIYPYVTLEDFSGMDILCRPLAGGTDDCHGRSCTLEIVFVLGAGLYRCGEGVLSVCS